MDSGAGMDWRAETGEATRTGFVSTTACGCSAGSTVTLKTSMAMDWNRSMASAARARSACSGPASGGALALAAVDAAPRTTSPRSRTSRGPTAM
jgi:hypothetical protein